MENNIIFFNDFENNKRLNESFANGDDTMYSTYYEKEFTRDEIEQAIEKYLKWCQKNEQTPEINDIDEITNDSELSHVLYHAEIEGYKIDESKVNESREDDEIDEDYLEYFLETYINGQYKQLRNMLKKIDEEGMYTKLVKYLTDLDTKLAKECKAWLLDNASDEGDDDSVDIDDEYMEYFLQTYINGQFKQLREMFKEIKNAGKVSAVKSFLNSFDTESANELIEWMTDNVNENINNNKKIKGNIEYVEREREDGDKMFTHSQAIKRIKNLLKDDDDILNGRKLSDISDDDLIEIGFNHYCFDYADIKEIDESASDCLHATYNEFGYTIWKGEEELYHAGNAKDSSEHTVPVSEGLPLEKIKEYSEQTGKEMAEEHGCEFMGSQYEKAEQAEEIEESNKVLSFKDFMLESVEDKKEDDDKEYTIFYKAKGKKEEICDTAVGLEEAEYLKKQYEIAYHQKGEVYYKEKK